MANRLLLTRVDGQVAQIPAGDALRLRGAINEPLPDNQTAATTINLGVSGSQTVSVTGSATIISLGADAMTVGTTRRLIFVSGGSVIKNNSAIILPAGDITVMEGDVFEFQCVNTFPIWKLISYMRGDGTPLVGAPDSTKLPLAGGQMTGALNEAPPVTIAAVDPIDFGNASNTVIITGNTAISGISTVGQGIGARRLLLFTGTPTLFHTANFVLPTKQNINVAAGDRAEFVYVSYGTWNCVAYTRADGTALASSGSGGASTYTWTQDTAAAVWTIPHNLNRYPSVTVVDTLGNVIVPDVSYVDSNTVQVTHGAAYAGKAYLN